MPLPCVTNVDNGKGPALLAFSSFGTPGRIVFKFPDQEVRMLVRPRDFADRISGTRQPKIFRRPIDAARCKAREIIDQVPQGGYVPVVENWLPLPDGQIEFTMRCLPTAD